MIDPSPASDGTDAAPRDLTASPLVRYGTIFVVAAATRLCIAYLFLGSVDIVNDTVDSARLLDGSLFSARVPYLPGIHLLLWIGGQLAVRSALPVAFCYKLFPCLFDSLVAVLIALSSPNSGRSLRLGYLYAFAPVPVIIVALHGQWDGVFLYLLILAIFLLRLDSRRGAFLAGIAFVLSVIAKPVAAPLLPFLFPAPWLLAGRRRDRNALVRTMTLIAAMGLTTATYLLLLAAMHSPLDFAKLRDIFAYAQHGVQLIGFRMFESVPRSIGLVSFVVLLPAYLWGRLSRENAILLFFAFVLGVCGSAPQYLCWIVPFALLTGRVAFGALYNFLCGIVLLLYYQAPGTLGRNVENLGTYSMLRRFTWLAPSLTNLSKKSQIVFYGGDVIIPFVALAFFAVALFHSTRPGRPIVARTQPATPLQLRAAGVSLLVVALGLGALCIWAKLQPPITGGALTQQIRARIDEEYWCVKLKEANPLSEAPIWVLPSFVNTNQAAQPVNAFTIGVAWTLIWTAAASAAARAWVVRRADHGD